MPDDGRIPSNIPIPDPSIATTAGLTTLRVEVKGWIDSLKDNHEQKIDHVRDLLVEKIEGAKENIGTRLDGNDTALVAALKAQKEEAAKQTENFKEVLGESKKGTEKQIDSLNDKIEDLKKRVFESGGRTQGIGSMVSMIISALAALAAVGSLIIVIAKSFPV